MPCINFPIDQTLGPFLNIGIAPAASLNPSGAAAMGQAPSNVQWIKAIADTGCTLTSIYSGIAAGLNLPVISKCPVNNTTHTTISNVYLCDLFIKLQSPGFSFDYRFADRRVIELTRYDTRFDALLGMDILSIGMFTINGPLKTASLCF